MHSFERENVRSFAEAAASYLKAEPRARGDKRLIDRILSTLGANIALSEMNQELVDKIRDKVLLKPNPSPATVRRSIISPIRAIMMHACRRGWCDRPWFEIPRQPAGRTVYLTPAEAKRLVAAAAPHLKPLLILLLCTGARLGEALGLDWREVDLKGRRVTFFTKATRGEGRRRRVVPLEPHALFALAELPHREGAVFRWETRRGSGVYADLGRQSGGQIKTGWKGALKRAGIRIDITPHGLRHTWASWHYAIHKDPMLLKVEGQWRA